MKEVNKVVNEDTDDKSYRTDMLPMLINKDIEITPNDKNIEYIKKVYAGINADKDNKNLFEEEINCIADIKKKELDIDVSYTKTQLIKEENTRSGKLQNIHRKIDELINEREKMESDIKQLKNIAKENDPSFNEAQVIKPVNKFRVYINYLITAVFTITDAISVYDVVASCLPQLPLLKFVLSFALALMLDTVAAPVATMIYQLISTPNRMIRKKAIVVLATMLVGFVITFMSIYNLRMRNIDAYVIGNSEAFTDLENDEEYTINQIDENQNAKAEALVLLMTLAPFSTTLILIGLFLKSEFDEANANVINSIVDKRTRKETIDMLISDNKEKIALIEAYDIKSEHELIEDVLEKSKDKIDLEVANIISQSHIVLAEILGEPEAAQWVTEKVE